MKSPPPTSTAQNKTPYHQGQGDQNKTLCANSSDPIRNKQGGVDMLRAIAFEATVFAVAGASFIAGEPFVQLSIWLRVAFGRIGGRP